MSIHSLFGIGIALISVSICASIFFDSSKERKWYHKLVQTLFTAFFLFYVLICVSSFTPIQEFINVIVTMLLVSSILRYKKYDSEKVYMVSFLSAALLFGLQSYFNKFDHNENSNKETILRLMIDLKNDFISSDLDEMDSQNIKNYSLRNNFEEYMKYKETVCTLKLDGTEKKAKLVAFNMDHQKDALEYKHGVKAVSVLIYGMSEKMSMLKNVDVKQAYNLQQKRMKNIHDYGDKLGNFIYNFDDCSYKDKLKSNTLFDESEKAEKTVDEVRKEAEAIIFPEFKNF